MRRLSIHVGSSKTGTSALQLGLWESTDALAAAGVGLPFVGRQEHIQKLLRPLGWVVGSGFTKDPDRGRLRSLVGLLEATSGDRLLISNEDLAECRPAQVEAVRRRSPMRPASSVHVVLTARDWAEREPSEWQQFLKRRLTTDYLTFLDEVREQSSHIAEQFWLRQDVLDICARWGAPGSNPSSM